MNIAMREGVPNFGQLGNRYLSSGLDSSRKTNKFMRDSSSLSKKKQEK